MDNGYYAAVTALVGRMHALDITAHNVANANTTGFRAERQHFSSVLADAQGQEPFPFGVLAGTNVDLTQGSIEKTGNELDLAIEGGGFFAVKTANGTRYTRDGSFHLDRQGTLVDAKNEPVLSDTGAEIKLPTGKVTVNSDGTVAVDDAVAGKLAVLSCDSSEALTPAGDNQFAAAATHMKTATQFAVQQGALEGSNITPVEGAVQLIQLQRHAEMMDKVVQIFNSDFNRTAIEQVARTS